MLNITFYDRVGFGSEIGHTKRQDLGPQSIGSIGVKTARCGLRLGASNWNRRGIAPENP